MHLHPSRLIAVLALLVVTTLVFAEKPSLPASGDCKDGQYKGRASGRVPYIKDPYTWAVTPEFARRFCMPKEFIDPALKGAEAIAYWKKPSADEWCRQVNGEEKCDRGHSHWLELYVRKDAPIPKYDRTVGFYVRDSVSSRNTIGIPPRQEDLKARLDKMFGFRRTGGVFEPPGQQSPFRGYTPEAEGKAISFHYLARVTESTVAERAAALRPDFYEAGLFDDLDVIGLRGWIAGNLEATGRMTPARLGHAIGVWSGSKRPDEWTYPGDFGHVIEIPERIVNVMHANDRVSGLAEAFKSMTIDLPSGAKAP